MLQVHVRNYDGSFAGEESLYSKVDVVVRHRDVSSWAVTMPNTAMAEALRQPGAGISIRRKGQTLVSGPTVKVERTVSDTTDSFVISGLSDECMLWDYVCQPSQPRNIGGGLFQFDEYDTFNGPAESVIKHYVQANLLDPLRSVPQLTIAPDLGRGPQVSANARFNLVGDLINGLFTTMGYTVIDGVFDIYEPVDRSADQLFSLASGNLLSYAYSFTAPKVTHPYVAGGGVGAARVFYLGSDAGAVKWGRRIESFYDARDTSDVPTLQQRSNKAISDGGEQTTVTLRPIDVPRRTFGVDYDRGDITTIEGVVATVAQVEIALDDTGETITPSGSASNPNAAQTVLDLFDKLRMVRRQMLELQTNY